jgi:hypothetical protein
MFTHAFKYLVKIGGTQNLILLDRIYNHSSNELSGYKKPEYPYQHSLVKSQKTKMKIGTSLSQSSKENKSIQSSLNAYISYRRKEIFLSLKQKSLKHLDLDKSQF